MTLQFERLQGAMMPWVAGGIALTRAHAHNAQISLQPCTGYLHTPSHSSSSSSSPFHKQKSFHTPNRCTSDRRHITSRCLQNTIPDVSGISIHAKHSEQHKSNKHCNNNIRKTDIVLLAKLVIWEFFIYCKWGREQLPNTKTNKPFSPVKCELFLSHEDKIKLVPHFI